MFLLLIFVGTTSTADDYVIHVGHFNCDHFTVGYVSQKTNIYEKLGLKAEITAWASQGDIVKEMTVGKMDIGYIGVEVLARQYFRGAPIVGVDSNHLGGSYYIVARNEIKGPKELIGKRVAVDSSEAYEKTLREWIHFARVSGIPVEFKNYKMSYLATDKEEYLAFKAGDLDAFCTCDPWASMVEYEKTGRIICTVATRTPGVWGMCDLLTMSKSFIEAHPELAKKVIVAHSKAIEFIYTLPLKTAEIFSKSLGVPIDVALMSIYKKTVDENRSLSWKLDIKNVQEAVDWALDVKNIPEAAKKTDYIRYDLFEQSGADDFDKFMKEKADPVFPHRHDV